MHSDSYSCNPNYKKNLAQHYKSKFFVIGKLRLKRNIHNTGVCLCTCMFIYLFICVKAFADCKIYVCTIDARLKIPSSIVT